MKTFTENQKDKDRLSDLFARLSESRKSMILDYIIENI